jgi:transcriptional regulator with GAF, ATPase, and Fis domain
MRGWIGVDLDGTLAKSVKARNREEIGVPIRPMVQLVKVWLARRRCPSDGVFSVDAAWWSKDSRRVSLPQQPEHADADEDAHRERQIIEDALAGSRGRVSGPDGAAARLRVPASTLENRIKKLRIRKSHFKLS